MKSISAAAQGKVGFQADQVNAVLVLMSLVPHQAPWRSPSREDEIDKEGKQMLL